MTLCVFIGRTPVELWKLTISQFQVHKVTLMNCDFTVTQSSNNCYGNPSHFCGNPSHFCGYLIYFSQKHIIFISFVGSKPSHLYSKQNMSFIYGAWWVSCSTYFYAPASKYRGHIVLPLSFSPSIYPLVWPSVRPSICLFVRLSVCLHKHNMKTYHFPITPKLI